MNADYDQRAETLAQLAKPWKRVLVVWIAGILISSVAGLVVLYFAGIVRHPRPMFHNLYVAFPDHGFLPTWRVFPPGLDQSGNVVFADHTLNVLVVIGTGQPSAIDACYWKYGMRETVFSINSYELLVSSSTRDTAFILLADGRRTEFPIPSGRAEELHNLAGNDYVQNILDGLRDVQPEGSLTDREAVRKEKTSG